MIARRTAALLAVALASVVTLAWTACKKKDPIEIRPMEPATGELKEIKQLPDFQLIDSTGKTVTLADLKGTVWIADFFYTTCPGPCAALSNHMNMVQTNTESLGDVRLVSISTDPVKDTPEVLQGYAKKFGAGPRWRFLTGDKAAIYDLARNGFMLPLVEDPANKVEPITHATRIVLVDWKGVIRGYYDGLTPQGLSRLQQDVKMLIGEMP